MVNFVRLLTKEKQVNIDSVYSSAVQLSDGVIVKVNDRYYRVNLSADQNTYSLSETWLINPELSIIK